MLTDKDKIFLEELKKLAVWPSVRGGVRNHPFLGKSFWHTVARLCGEPCGITSGCVTNPLSRLTLLAMGFLGDF